MTRLGLGLCTLGALALLGALGLAWARERGEPWRTTQERYRALLLERDESSAAAAEPVRPHELAPPGLTRVDRCTTCHLGMEPGAEAFDERPFGAHPGRWLETHPVGRFGCTSCHGGQGRSLDPALAHDRRHGGGPDAFTPAGARCGRCHPAGGLPGSERVGRGAALYFEHGCPGCHQPGRPGPGIGPDLGAIGLRGGSYLRKALLYPDHVYPLTIMPPLRYRMAERGPELDALVAYLRTLEPWPAGVPREEERFDPRSCTGCHRVADGDRQPGGPGHGCTYLHDEAGWLACARCHGERAEVGGVDSPVPAMLSAGAEGAPLSERLADELRRAALPARADDPAGACPVIAEAAAACGVCHRRGEIR